MFKSIKIKALFMFVAVFGAAGAYAQTNEVSDSELNKFADAYINIQMQNQEAQQEMMTVIQQEGLEVERFNEIQQAVMDPNAKNDATEDEMKKHAKVTAKFEQMQPELERRAKEGIESKGLTFERFQQLATVIQNDVNLQQKLQGILLKHQ